jgi:hypothetical protein
VRTATDRFSLRCRTNEEKIMADTSSVELDRSALPRAGATVRTLRHLLSEIREQEEPMTQSLLEVIVTSENAMYEQFGHDARCGPP